MRNITKICSVCFREKRLSLFPKNGGFQDGLLNKCKLCKNAEAKIYYKKNDKRIAAHVRAHASRNKDKIRNRNLKNKFGITLDDYNVMSKNQNGQCFICGKSEKIMANNGSRIKYLAVDHCHKTGKIRGLLCGRCNTAIGSFDDDLLLIGRAMEYLVQARSK